MKTVKLDKQPMTLEEFRSLSEGPPYYEFEDGELILVTSPHGQHQRVLRELLIAVGGHVKTKRLGEIWPELDVELPNGKVYIPDLVYLKAEHLDRYDPDAGNIRGVPDLVVEIISPSTRNRDRTKKFNAYYEAGVPWQWLVEPDDLIVEEYRWTPEGYLCTARIAKGRVFRPGLFPGLRINLAKLLE